MSFSSTGPKTRPERVKPPSTAPPISPLPSGWSATTASQTPRHRSTSNASSASSTSFHSAASQHESSRFTPAKEATMIDASNAIKSTANGHFAAADYDSAITTYDRALAELPSYLDYELAVLQSNIAACHLKLSQWKEALTACEAGLDGLERELPMPKPANIKQSNGQPTETQDTADQVVELPSDSTDAELTTHLQNLNLSDARKSAITRIRLKLLLRRARARSLLTPPSWSHLAGALDDYTALSQPEYFTQLPVSDQKTVRHALTTLPGKVEEAKQKEVGEMMGKLKEVGNGILGKFGLSTDMFKMTQDPNTGGWSVGFDQGAGGGAKKEGGAAKEGQEAPS